MYNIKNLVRQMTQHTSEFPWLEFKENNCDPQMIGENISALANTAAYCGRSKAYLIWGITDSTRQICGTTFNPNTLKKGNQSLEIWLRTQLSDNAEYEFLTTDIGNKTVVVLIINKAVERTVMFQKTEYIRVGSSTKKLNDVPTMKATLWDHIRDTRFEELPALENLTLFEVLQALDYSVYFGLQKMPIPTGEETIAHYLKEDHLILQQDDGLYTISNLGAILLARNIGAFPTVSRKAARVIQYRGENRLEILRELSDKSGYAIGYENLIRLIETMLPASEIIEDGIRRTELAYPSLAIRETIANALIHQNLILRGTGPLIEIFSNRIEVTNPGLPLVDVLRIVDNPPRSRNERLAAMMRRFHICEESGTGWDKIILSNEMKHLPAPKISIYDDNMKVTLYASMNFNELLQEDKLWACYLHACVRYVEEKQMNNTSLRERFGLEENYKSQISRLIRLAVDQNLIKPFDPATAPRYMRYVPIWV